MKEFLRRLVPPLFLDIYRARLLRYGFFGNYLSWQEAKDESGGYDSEVILEKVKKSLLLVKDGKAVYERDSVIFDKVYMPWPLIAGLLRVASKRGNRLILADYGGSLGSTYFQCREFLSDLELLSWNIVEQKKFVECGKKHFEDHQLRFFYELNLCVKETDPDILLLSSVLQYLEKPYDFIEYVLSLQIPYILIDRTAFLLHGNDRLTVQKVLPSIYPASYPAWFFNEELFKSKFSGRYELLEEFIAQDVANIPSIYKGFIYRLKPEFKK